MNSIFCKDSPNRAKNEMNLFISYSEVQAIFYKISPNRVKNEMNSYISSFELPANLCKVSHFHLIPLPF